MDYAAVIVHLHDPNDPRKPYLAAFHDLEGGLAGATIAEALDHALISVFGYYIDDNRTIPPPKTRRRPRRSETLRNGDRWETGYLAHVPLRVEAKIKLYKAMRDTRVTRDELAQRLGVGRLAIDRLLSLRASVSLGGIDAAFQVLGKRLTFAVERMPADTTGREARNRDVNLTGAAADKFLARLKPAPYVAPLPTARPKQ